jgi:hypothetical protein
MFDVKILLMMLFSKHAFVNAVSVATRESCNGMTTMDLTIRPARHSTIAKPFEHSGA